MTEKAGNVVVMAYSLRFELVKVCSFRSCSVFLYLIS